jgi:hypothetical protein
MYRQRREDTDLSKTGESTCKLFNAGQYVNSAAHFSNNPAHFVSNEEGPPNSVLCHVFVVAKKYLCVAIA